MEETTKLPAASNDPVNTVRKRTNDRRGQYSKFEPLVDRGIQRLRDLLESKNENAVLGALKILFDRTVPAIKALEISGEDGQPIKFNIIAGADASAYLSQSAGLTPSPNQGTFGRSSEVQSLDLASQSQEDNNSNQSNSEVEST